MIEIPLQISKDYQSLIVLSKEDKEALKEFGVNQIVTAKLTGFKKPRSLRQLHTYWSCCEYVAQQLSDHETQYTKEDIDFQTKIRVMKQNPAMIKRFKFIDGVMFIEPLSISFVNLEHIEANHYFDKGFSIIAAMIGLSVEELLDKVKNNMGQL